MKWSFLKTSYLLLISAGVIGYCGFLFFNEKAEGMLAPTSTEKVRIHISTAKDSFLIGEPLPVTATVTNIGVSPIGFFSDWDRGYYPYSFKATNSLGQEFPLTAAGTKNAEWKNTKWLLQSSSQRIDQTIGAGASLQQLVFINRFIDFTSLSVAVGKTETIQIQVQRYGQTSNTLSLKLTNADFYVEGECQKNRYGFRMQNSGADERKSLFLG